MILLRRPERSAGGTALAVLLLRQAFGLTRRRSFGGFPKPGAVGAIISTTVAVAWGVCKGGARGATGRPIDGDDLCGSHEFRSHGSEVSSRLCSFHASTSWSSASRGLVDRT
jgi:hypothetical protein